MTKRNEIFNMPAGAQMDALVFQYIFSHAAIALNIPTRNYSTDIADAWRVAEKLCATVGKQPVSGLWLAYIDSNWAEAETAPLAICRAALIAVMEREGKEIDG